MEASGEFDPENNPEHQRMLEKAGIILEEYKAGAGAALDKRAEELNTENERLERERQERVEKIREVRERDDPDDIEAYDETKRLRAENMAAWEQQTELQAHREVEDIAELAENLEVRASFSGPEEEVSAFMKEFAQTQLIEDELTRLAREQELIAGLSEAALEYAMFNKETEKLFEDGYFDALKSESAQLTEKENTPAVRANPPSSL